MKIAVCIKRVPEMDVRFKIGASGTGVDEAGLKWDISDFDGYALEAALQMTEKLGSGEMWLEGDNTFGGEIVVDGPNVAKGYWFEPEASRRTFRGGRLYTGDLATTDADGWMTLAGRTCDFLKLGGVRIEVNQIERRICEFPDMHEAAVISKHDDVLGETVVLFAVHPLGEKVRHELTDFCATHLPFSQRPREIHFRAQLPRDLQGKPDRRVLLDELMFHPPAIAEQLQAGGESAPAQ